MLLIVLVATDTAAASEILTSPPTDTLSAALTTVALTVAESVAEMLTAPSASTEDVPMTPASMVLIIVLVTPTPAPAPERLTVPLPTPTLNAAATPWTMISPDEPAWASKVPALIILEPPSTTARVVLVMSLMATLTPTANEAELSELTEALSAAATTSALMVVASVAFRATKPPVEVTSALRMMANTELFVVLPAPAPAPVNEIALPLLLLTLTLADAATTTASMSLDEDAVTETSPVAKTSTLSIIASVVLLMILSAADTTTPPLILLSLLLIAMLSWAEIALALMTPLSVALRVTMPPAVTMLGVPGAESSIAARVVELMSLVVTPTLALMLAAAPSLDWEMVNETPNAKASMDPVLEAVTSTLPPALIVVSSIIAVAELVISLIAMEMPRPIPTLVPSSTLIDRVTAPAVAVIVLASSAETSTLPLAVTVLGSMMAETSLLMKLPEPDPAPARASVPSVESAPATPKVRALIVDVALAVTLTLSTLPPLALTFFKAAVVVLVMWFSAAAAPTAMAPKSPELPELPPVDTVRAPEAASASISLSSLAAIVMLPFAIKF